MSDKKYSNLHPKELLKLKKALEYGVKKDPLKEKQLKNKARREAIEDYKKARKEALKKAKQEIVKPSKSMMVDTTTGMGANIFVIPKKKPKKKKK